MGGDYVELAPLEAPLLTLIPTAMFGPPEKVWSDKTETTVPGLVVAPHGRGGAAYIPTDQGITTRPTSRRSQCAISGSSCRAR